MKRLEQQASYCNVQVVICTYAESNIFYKQEMINGPFQPTTECFVNKKKC